jgi:hypothetical protein
MKTTFSLFNLAQLVATHLIVLTSPIYQKYISRFLCATSDVVPLCLLLQQRLVINQHHNANQDFADVLKDQSQLRRAFLYRESKGWLN